MSFFSRVYVLLALLLPAIVGRAQDYRLKIGLLQDVATATVAIDEHTRVRDMATGEMFVVSTGTLEAEADGAAVRLGEASARTLEISHPLNRFTLDGKSYPGRLLLRASDGALTAINELDLETYLEGVLPEEMSPSWSMEALKAQAVVSRTYAVYNFGQFHQNGFDLAADPRSQVYKGFEHADPRVHEAVQATKGQVLTYNGEILNAYFHSCCGGHTRAAFRAWRSGHPVRPLMGVVDTFCSLSPNFSWEAYFPYGDVLTAVQKNGVMATKLKSIKVGAEEASGYASSFRVSTDAGENDIPAEPFRKALDASQLRSSFIVKIAKRGKGYVFYGHGYGHGVGMCQWGARAQADKGRKYKNILEFYYPDSTLRVLDEPGG